MPFQFGAAGDGLNLTYEQLLALQERLGGSVPRGATAEQVAALPTRRYVPREGAAPADATCSICLADFEAGDELRALPCSHAYHSGCIDQWLKTSRQCPCCRREL
jgi:E3 ubiquitin-protein ligase BIG BROTHER-like protein